jgi:hypothetical protein
MLIIILFTHLITSIKEGQDDSKKIVFGMAGISLELIIFAKLSQIERKISIFIVCELKEHLIIFIISMFFISIIVFIFILLCLFIIWVVFIIILITYVFHIFILNIKFIKHNISQLPLI